MSERALMGSHGKFAAAASRAKLSDSFTASHRRRGVVDASRALTRLSPADVEKSRMRDGFAILADAVTTQLRMCVLENVSFHRTEYECDKFAPKAVG